MRFLSLAFALLTATYSYAQDSEDDKPDYRVTIGVNLRKPIPGGTLRTIFPLIHFKKNTTQKTLVGGVNVGISRFFLLTSRFHLKTSLNFSRQVHWNEPVLLNKGPNPQDQLGIIVTPSVEYYGSLSGVVHYSLGRFSPGIGLAFEGLITSTRKFSNINGLAGSFSTWDDYRNKEFKTIMPVFPIEVSWKGDLMLYNIRYEAGLVTHYRGKFIYIEKMPYGMICFEVGMRIK